MTQVTVNSLVDEIVGKIRQNAGAELAVKMTGPDTAYISVIQLEIKQEDGWECRKMTEIFNLNVHEDLWLKIYAKLPKDVLKPSMNG